jgi:hypothetical protein
MRRKPACRGEIKVLQHNAVLNRERLLFDEKPGPEGDPSSQKPLLGMTAKKRFRRKDETTRRSGSLHPQRFHRIHRRRPSRRNVTRR